MSKSIKEMLKDIPEVTDAELPTIEERRKFLDEQIDQYKKVVYRFTTDIEADKEFIEIGQSEDAEEFLQTGKQGLANDIGQLRGAVAKLKVLVKIREQIGD